MSPHRSTYRQPPLSYVEIGASEAADLLRFPPNGATPFEEATHIGSGEARFFHVANRLMTLRVFELADFELLEVTPGTDPSYGASDEGLFGPDGTAYYSTGTQCRVRFGKQSERTLSVVRVVHEAQEIGFVLGTVDRDGPTGEFRFTVQLRDDDRVWITSRGFFHPPEGLLGGRAVKHALGRVKKLQQALRPGVSDPAAADPQPESATPEES